MTVFSATRTSSRARELLLGHEILFAGTRTSSRVREPLCGPSSQVREVLCGHENLPRFARTFPRFAFLLKILRAALNVRARKEVLVPETKVLCPQTVFVRWRLVEDVLSMF